MESMRIDKWLWAARFFKTRSLALDAIAKGQVQKDDHAIKPAKEIRVGDTLTVWQARVKRVVAVQGLSAQRGPAPVAQQLYAETPESIAERAAAAEHQRLHPEPAMAITQGRPTKRDRRALEKGWDKRWSASID
jgi:ribosome-associated heat shock protein Hsp15